MWLTRTHDLRLVASQSPFSFQTRRRRRRMQLHIAYDLGPPMAARREPPGLLDETSRSKASFRIPGRRSRPALWTVILLHHSIEDQARPLGLARER